MGKEVAKQAKGTKVYKKTQPVRYAHNTLWSVC